MVWIVTVDTEPEPKLFQSRNRNRNKYFQFQNTPSNTGCGSRAALIRTESRLTTLKLLQKAAKCKIANLTFGKVAGHM